MHHDDLDYPSENVTLDATRIASLALLDHHGVDWGRVQRTAYLIHQHLRYEYPGPIEDLRHRLVVIPPPRLGDQRRVVHRIDVTGADASCDETEDDFGNVVVTVDAPCVESYIDFEAWTVVERGDGAIPHLPGRWLVDPRLCEPSPLTIPDEALRRAAAHLAAGDGDPSATAARINHWVYRAIRYEHGVTHVHTTAGEALAFERGVCQDFAHIMLALCRLCGIPARYVSGHLLGEGGTHAWVEALVPAGDGAGGAVALGFDPSHGRPTDLTYVTVAVGRDYADVAPTSGTFRAAYGGRLSASKRVRLTEVQYADAL